MWRCLVACGIGQACLSHSIVTQCATQSHAPDPPQGQRGAAQDQSPLPPAVGGRGSLGFRCPLTPPSPTAVRHLWLRAHLTIAELPPPCSKHRCEVLGKGFTNPPLPKETVPQGSLICHLSFGKLCLTSALLTSLLAVFPDWTSPSVPTNMPSPKFFILT